MRTFLIVSLVVGSAAPAFCEEDRNSEEVNRIIQKALDAHGGEDKLKQLTSFVETTESTNAYGIVAKKKRYIQFPSHCRTETEFGPASNLKPCVIVQTAERRWRKLTDRPVRDFGPTSQLQKNSVKFAGPRIVLQLVDPETKVTLIGQAKLGDKDVVGVTVADVKFFFDSQSGLLIKRETPGGETLYSNYKPVDGIPVAREITHKRKGKVSLTTIVFEFKVVDKHDPALFEKPQ
jgi:hypothetical protein